MTGRTRRSSTASRLRSFGAAATVLAKGVVIAIVGTGAATAEIPQWTIEYSPTALKAVETETAYYVRFRDDGAGLRATELARRAPASVPEGEEILVILPRSGRVLPMFRPHEFNPPTKTFQCMPLVNKKTDEYHPCARGSQFVSKAGMASVGRNAVALLTTAGLASGVDYKINVDAIKTALDQSDLASVLNAYEKLGRDVAAERKSLGELDAGLKQAAQPVIQARDASGLGLPADKSVLVKVRFSRDTSLEWPDPVDISGGVAAIASLEGAFRARAEELRTNPIFDVTCEAGSPASYQVEITCDKSTTPVDGQLRPVVGVVLVSRSFEQSLPAIDGKDSRLTLAFSGDLLNLTNLTGEYIEVSAISFYGGSEITENEVSISLSPFASLKGGLQVGRMMSPELRKNFALTKVTHADVAGRTVPFGIAVKYRLGEGGNWATLLVRQQIPLVSLVSSRGT